MATNTYVALTPSITLASNTTTVTLSSIPSGYTDLRLVIVPASSDGTNGIRMRINGDTGSNYSITYLSGNGTSAISNRESSASQISLSYFGGITTSLGGTQVAIDFQNYSNTTTYKTALVRYNMASSSAEANVALWRSTSAITSLSFNINSFGSSTGDFIAGSTFSLYGIKAWTPEVTPKATGGYVYSDSTYWYHAFSFTGVFTPLQSLTADVMVVAGGGGAGWDDGGAGGAGGLALQTGRSFSATSYTCTIGAGGPGGSSGVIGYNGSNTTLDTITATGGGGGGTGNAEGGRNGANGGSGGGGSYRSNASASQNGVPGTGITGTSGGATLYGNSGGSGNWSSYYGTGGGGGAGAVGGNGSTTNGGNGGIGRTDSFINAIGSATGVGQLVGTDYYIAGGGGGSVASGGTPGAGGYGGGSNGGNTIASYNARANTGGGGGADGSNGGSGVIVIRYLKA